ncbi:MAG: ATP-binding protein [Pirellulales bacterium]|nr:ATP-binding protein [Pirellulales bacterium]
MEDSRRAAALATILAHRIGPQRFDLWFNLQAQLGVSGSELTIQASSPFVRDWLRTNLDADLRACWESIAGTSATVSFQVIPLAATSPATRQLELAISPNDAESHSLEQAAPQNASERAPERRRRNAAKIEEPPAATNGAQRTKLSPDKCEKPVTPNLASFVVGPSNEYAFRSAELTARGRQQASPLLLWGPTGVGKTHLLRAVQQAYSRYRPRAVAIYLTAEQFTTHFVDAIRGAGLPSFRQKCRGANLLILDDLQFLVGKQRTLEELLYTLDSLTHEGRQVVFGSDRGLGELRLLGPELVSRLAGGLACEIAPPEFATRLGIVRQLAEVAGIALAEDAATLVATQITAGARELRGALHRLQALSTTTGQPISRDLADRTLADLARHNTRNVRLADIQKVVCDAFGVEPVQLRSERKARAVAEPRMLAMWLARKFTRAPLSEIGEFFGRGSHSTVIAAHRRVEKLIASEAHISLADHSCPMEEAIRRLETALRTA